MLHKYFSFALVLIIALAGCGIKEEGTIDPAVAAAGEVGVFPKFDPANGVLPFPNNLMFTGTTDGTLNVPVSDASDLSDPKVALNAMDGFSTSAFLSAAFSGVVDQTNLIAGTHYYVYRVTLTSKGAIVSVDEDVSANFVGAVKSTATESTVVLIPIVPMQSATSYAVVLTDSITYDSGKAIFSPITYHLAKSTSALVDAAGKSTTPLLTDDKAVLLEPLRQLTNYNEVKLVTAGVPSRDDIVLSWTFTTQDTTSTLAAVRSAVSTSPTVSIDSTVNALSADASFSNADIHVGYIDVPYYLDPANPITGHWKADPMSSPDLVSTNITYLNPMPVEQTTKRIPLLVTVPKASLSCPTPLPVVIFQHGITGDRTNMLGVANTLTGACFAVVAIDLPLHGIVTDSYGLKAATAAYSSSVTERYPNVDLVNNATLASGADDSTDPSGAHFMNLKYLLTLRDNSRQAIADLFVLTKAIEFMSYDGVVGGDFDKNNIYFMGHSLGAIFGSVFLSYESTVKDAVLAMPGGGLARMVDASPTFGPLVQAGLADAGVTKGSADYEAFLTVAQTMVDSVDPINYASGTVTGRDVLMFEVVGDASANPAKLPDQVVPNSVATAPLSGTAPLAALMGLLPAKTANSVAADHLTKFKAGNHSSILDPTASADVTTEMQTEMAGFFVSGGALSLGTNAGTLLAP